jgi:hypothetical protein
MKPVMLYLGHMLKANIAFENFDHFERGGGYYLFNEEQPNERRRLSRFMNRET